MKGEQMNTLSGVEEKQFRESIHYLQTIRPDRGNPSLYRTVQFHLDRISSLRGACSPWVMVEKEQRIS